MLTSNSVESFCLSACVFIFPVCERLCSSTMGQVYSEHRDEDGFLYVTYSGENTFGRFSIRQQRHLAAADEDDGDV